MKDLNDKNNFSPDHPKPRLLVVGPKSPRITDFLSCLNNLICFVESLAETADDAISRAPGAPLDLVFVDVDLPGPGSVFETADAIRRACSAPVVFLCVAGGADRIPPSLLSLPFGYLESPFTGKDVRRMMETALYAASLEKQVKTARQAQNEVESRYLLLADNVTDVLFTMDMDLNYTYVSPSVKKLRGYDSQEMIGTSFFEKAPPEACQIIASALKEELKQEASGKLPLDRLRLMEVEMYRKDGSKVWIESNAAFLRDENQRPIGIIGVNRDITERRMMLDRLRESEEKFRALAEGCPYGIMIYQDDYWVYVNPTAEKFTGYSREEFYQMRFWEILHPDYQALAREQGAKRQAGQLAPQTYDFKIIKKGGAALWVSLSATTLIYGGRPAGFIAVIDISERKKAEAALKESEARYRTILESIEDGYYEVDLKGSFTFYNDMLCRISGYSREEIMSVNYRQYTDADNAAKLFSTFRKVFETRTPARAVTLMIFQKDGLTRHVEISVSLIQDSSGQAVGFRGIIRDINERMAAEEHRRKLEAQLRHALKMEAVGTLAGGIAHDFNNILQAISGYTQLLLLNKPPDHPDTKKLIQIQQSGERASRLVQQLLTFSRKKEGSPRPLSLNHEIRQVEELLRQTVPKMIAIDLNLDAGVWAVKADPMHIEQILLNLGSNAVDAMPDGGRLAIETRNMVLDQKFCKDHLYATPGNYVLMMITDTGAGMDATTVAHMFDPFFTTKAVGKGMGLGLASVHGIVKTLGGYILCYSEPGRGSVFKIYLPAVDEKPAASADAHPRENQLMGGAETILVVDDEPTVREAAGEMLAYYGYEVLFAENGESALEIYRRQMDAIDLVLMDISMPGMGGYQCMREMTKLNPSARVIIASGYATSGHAREAMDLGAAGFVGKPYRISDIIATVRDVLDRA